MKTKKFLLIVIMAMLTMVILSTNVQAALESKPVRQKQALTDYASNWVIKIREMEKTGQGMGLNEKIDTTTGLATTESNNIDVHLLKNTEYGAIVLLGASDYGKQGTGTAKHIAKGTTTRAMTGEATTTGNVTGVYELGYRDMNVSQCNYELVAGGLKGALGSVAPRYYNEYTTEQTSARAGDATIEGSTKIARWQGSQRPWLDFFRLPLLHTWLQRPQCVQRCLRFS